MVAEYLNNLPLATFVVWSVIVGTQLARRRIRTLTEVSFVIGSFSWAGYALGLGGEAKSLSKVASAVLWVAVLLAGLLSLDTLFRGDAEDGSLEQWILAPVPLAWLVAVRVLTHWATTALPLIVATPLLGELLHLPRAELPVLLASLLLGTPLLSLLGAVVAALTVGMRRSGILVALLALPLYVPVLVFGAGAIAQSAQGLDAVGALLLLAAGLVVAVLLAPLTAAAAIRIALN